MVYGLLWVQLKWYYEITKLWNSVAKKIEKTKTKTNNLRVWTEYREDSSKNFKDKNFFEDVWRIEDFCNNTKGKCAIQKLMLRIFWEYWLLLEFWTSNVFHFSLKESVHFCLIFLQNFSYRRRFLTKIFGIFGLKSLKLWRFFNERWIFRKQDQQV